jgi:glutamate formiminotransferase/formiminotetrahydrofolate cyclodeaminase
MVANLSAHKAGWDERWDFFSDWAIKGQKYKEQLLFLVDEDTNAFNKIIDGFRMPKDTDLEKKIRLDAIENATKYATEIPFKVMETSFQSMEIMQAMLKDGLKNSLSDAGVGVLCARAAVIGAYFNVRINAKDIKDRGFATDILNKASTIYEKTIALEQETISFIDSQM